MCHKVPPQEKSSIHNLAQLLTEFQTTPRRIIPQNLHGVSRDSLVHHLGKPIRCKTTFQRQQNLRKVSSFDEPNYSIEIPKMTLGLRLLHAAHAAQQNEKRQVAQALQAQKQAQAAEADAFRGLHLKSNHHWDEVWIRNRACVFGRLTLQSRMREMTEIS